MLRNFENLVNETLQESFMDGIKMFMEGLESELQLDAIVEQAGGEEKFFASLFEGTEYVKEGEVSEDVIDKLIAELEKDPDLKSE